MPQDVGNVDKPGTMRFAGALLRLGIHIIPRGALYFLAAHTDAGIAAMKSALTIAFDAVAASSQDGYLSVAKEHAS